VNERDNLSSSLKPATLTGGGLRVRTGLRAGSDRQRGTVKSFDDSKGYGFITSESGQDVFVHFRSIQGNGFKTLKVGQQVSFSAVQGQKGLQAEQVQPANP
jgi:cold shock protein